MKSSLILLIIFCSLCSLVNAQTVNYEFYDTKNIHNKLRLNVKTGEVIQIQDDGITKTLQKSIEPDSMTSRFKLIKTENMWNFILLDEFAGRLWQVQFTVQGDEYALSIPINPSYLSDTKVKKFEVQPLASMYQFYLINDENGEMWKFQWTTKGNEYRWIEKMKK